MGMFEVYEENLSLHATNVYFKENKTHGPSENS